MGTLRDLFFGDEQEKKAATVDTAASDNTQSTETAGTEGAGFEEVRAESRAEGRQEEKINNLKAMMENTGWSAEKAMDTLNIPKQEQAKYAAML